MEKIDESLPRKRSTSVSAAAQRTSRVFEGGDQAYGDLVVSRTDSKRRGDSELCCRPNGAGKSTLLKLRQGGCRPIRCAGDGHNVKVGYFLSIEWRCWIEETCGTGRYMRTSLRTDGSNCFGRFFFVVTSFKTTAVGGVKKTRFHLRCPRAANHLLMDERPRTWIRSYRCRVGALAQYEARVFISHDVTHSGCRKTGEHQCGK